MALNDNLAMPLYTDYLCKGLAKDPKTWDDLSPSISCASPTAKPTPCKPPPRHDVSPVAFSPKALLWRMVVAGYGDQALYGATWLINKVPLGTPQIAELKRLTRVRASSIARAYEICPATATSPLMLLPRSIYPLIESSEKVNISYYLGCAMAEVCLPAAILSRPLLGSGGVSHLFHARLLESSDLAAKTVEVATTNGRKIDFVAFDKTLTGVHLAEAKGSGESMSYENLASGLLQCDAVVGVSVAGSALMSPASLNVAFTFFGQIPVNCGSLKIARSLRTSVFDYRQGPSAHKSAPHTLALAPSHTSPISRALKQLFGTKLLGLYLALQSGERNDTTPKWTEFWFGAAEGFEQEISVAIPSALLSQMESFWKAAEGRIERGPLFRKLQVALPDGAAEDVQEGNIDLSDALVEFGGQALILRVWDNLPIPHNFEAHELEPWLAFGERPADPVS